MKISQDRMKKLRIAQISNLFEPVTESSRNGLSQIVYILTQELVALGHEVTLYAPQASSTDAKLVALSSVSYASETILGKVLPVAAAFGDWKDFDIIHDHTRFYSTLFAHLLPIPLISTVHHTVEFDELHWHHPASEYDAFFRSTWKSLLRGVITVCVSRFQQSGFGDKAKIIYNGIPLDTWPHSSVSAGGYLAFLGAITETKGTHEAIKAALLANEAIVVAGTTDEDGEYFQQKVKPYIDGNRVKYVGPLDLKEKQSFLREAKAALLPIQSNEALPTVAIESLASGTPVIAWNHSSMGEIIENGKTGFLVSSIEELAARTHDLHQIDRKACRYRAERLFDSKQMAKNYVRLYRSVLGDR
ncbi:MAG TPA: glycosyltransferase family 4 protein [Terrimicrobiaceae bacterium]